ncbi:hypothetical protein GCM10009785_12870 [Brooklawnia cerclae]|uniref:Uncharacterized protein n=1 Tax=Brooklawnia cerclae TaxID=349934 RepID=A0ABX0SKB1_9ACTN|nr:hypothetical protein [Brooklawnia cerclae]NIH58798.1 hypothetical protein [Brooklawnia cerclae]
MDSEILASEQRHHRRFRRIYRSALFVILAAAVFGLVVAGFKIGARTGWIVTVGLVVIALVLVGMHFWLGRRDEDALASSGPWSFGQVYSGHQQRAIWNAMGQVLTGQRMSVTRVTSTTALCERPGSFLYRKGVHLVDVRESADHPGWFVVTVFASPDLPTTITDFGRGAGINHALLAAVPGHRKPGDPELADVAS